MLPGGWRPCTRVGVSSHVDILGLTAGTQGFSPSPLWKESRRRRSRVFPLAPLGRESQAAFKGFPPRPFGVRDAGGV